MAPSKKISAKETAYNTQRAARGASAKTAQGGKPIDPVASAKQAVASSKLNMSRIGGVVTNNGYRGNPTTSPAQAAKYAASKKKPR